MTTHLYCLVPIGTDRSGVVPARGVDDAPIRSLLIDPFIAWVSTIDRTQFPRDARAIEGIVRAHDAVIGAAIEAAIPVIPARATVPYADDAACVADVVLRTREIQQLVERIGDGVEMAVILTGPVTTSSVELSAAGPSHLAESRSAGPREAGRGAGRGYLESLRAATPAPVSHSTFDIPLGVLRLAVAGLTRDEATRDRPPDGVALSHLVARSSTSGYRERVGRAVFPDSIRVTVDGPRAAYSFAVFTPAGTVLAKGS